MRQKMDYITFILAGIRNKPGRNLATIFCFAFIAANIFSGQFLIAGAAGSVDRGVLRMGADHLVVPSQYMVFLRGAGPTNTVAIVMAEPSDYRIRADIMDRIGKLPNISAMSPQLYVSTLMLPGLASEPVNLYGIDPATDFTIQPWLQKPLIHPLGPGEVLLGNNVTGDISTKISVAGRTYTVAGRLDPTQSEVDSTIFLPLDDAYKLATVKGMVPPPIPQIVPGDVNAVLVRNAPGEDLDLAGKRLKRMISSYQEYKYISVIGRHFSLNPVTEDVKEIPELLNMISAFVVIIAFPLIALIAAMVAHERQREIGLLKSMGAKRIAIFFLVVVESLVLAAIGGIIGVVVSICGFILLNAQGVLNNALQVSFRMPSVIEMGFMAGLALLVVIVIGSLASLWPAYQSSRMNPYDAIRNEG